jgi:serine/threonine protein kinase
MSVVLFSNKEKCWKLADFGSTAEATSKRLNTTRFSRGTSGYRAPETLDLINPRFNQKSDIFALGCIIYELVTGEKLFFEDFVVFSYSTSGKLPKSVWWPASPASEPDRLQALELSAAGMLTIAPSERCNARQAQDALKFIRIGDNIPRFKFSTWTRLPVQVLHVF